MSKQAKEQKEALHMLRCQMFTDNRYQQKCMNQLFGSHTCREFRQLQLS